MILRSREFHSAKLKSPWMLGSPASPSFAKGMENKLLAGRAAGNLQAQLPKLTLQFFSVYPLETTFRRPCYMVVKAWGSGPVFNSENANEAPP